MALPQRDKLIVEIKRTDALLEYAVRAEYGKEAMMNLAAELTEKYGGASVLLICTTI